MNLPNKLSFLRIFLAFIFMFFLLSGGLVYHILALLVVIVAMLTDLFDGKIARERQLITNLGKLIDPLADKILTAAAFIAFLDLKLISSWFVVLIISREFAVTGLRLIASSKGNVIAVSKMGKHKTISQMVVILLILVLLITRDLLYIFIETNSNVLDIFNFWCDKTIFVAMIITVGLTLISGYVYVKENMGLFEE